MSVGVQPSTAQVNSQMAAMALALRNDFQSITNFSNWLNTVQVAGLEAMGFSAQDAAIIISSAGNMASLAAIYQGGAPGAAFNYMANTYPLWGGQ
jgi:hypothetical protein